MGRLFGPLSWRYKCGGMWVSAEGVGSFHAHVWFALTSPPPLSFQNAINTQQQWPQSIPPLGSIRLVAAQEVPRAVEGQTRVVHV